MNKAALAVITASILIGCSLPAHAKETRAHKIGRWVTAGVCLVPCVVVATAYSPIIAQIAMFHLWDKAFFERQRQLDAIEAEARANVQTVDGR